MKKMHNIEKQPGPIGRFRKRYSGHLSHIWAEEYVGWLTRNLPSMEGMLVRYGLYKLLFKKIESFALIYPGVYFTHTYGIEIGSRFSVNSGAILDGRGGIKIGNGVMIGPYAAIYSSGHNFAELDRPMTSLDHIMAPVVISDDVWIGAHVCIPGGITIGRGAVVAAGAVVVKDVEANTIVAGVPANTIRKRG
jgi:acetyltransferase-like isoleucine patch superfamily enzyme